MSLESELDLVLDDDLLIDLISLSDADLAAAAGSNSSVPQLLPNGLSKEDEEELLKTFTDEFSSDNHGAGRIVEVTDNLEELEQMLSGGSEASGSVGSQSPTGATDGFNSPANIGLQSPNSGYSCQVCHKETPKHNYYGAQACNSCRAFFRRSVTGDRFSEFKCDHNGTCEINSKSWRGCQKCRFQKCLCAGMEIASVFSDSECKANKRQIVIKRRQKTAIIKIPTDLYTLEESAFVKGLHKESRDFEVRVVTDFYGSKPDLFFDSMEVLGKQKGTLKNVQHSVALLAKIFRTFYHQLSEFQMFSEEDRDELLKVNFPLVTELYSSTYIKNKTNVNKYMKKSINYMQEKAKVDDGVAQVTEKLSQLDIDPSQGFNESSYDMIFGTLFGDDKESEQRHKNLMSAVSEWTGTDDVQNMIMVLVILFATDRVVLSSAKAFAMAQAVQAKYNYLLQKYLKGSYSKEIADKKFRQSIYVHSMVREAYFLKNRAMEKIGDADIINEV